MEKISLAGHWMSENIEVRPAPDGSNYYLRRDFTSTDKKSTAILIFYTDRTGSQKTLTLELEGPYEIKNASHAVKGAFEADFHFDTVKIIPHNKFFTDLLNSAPAKSCGLQHWSTNQQQDVTPTNGCSVLGVDLINKHTEYDLVKIEGNKLHYGARPSDGSGLDQPNKRPTALQVPLIRVE